MQISFTKDNLDTFLKELAKEYRRQVGKSVPAEITLIGGAAVLANYGFRDMTTDIDALIRAASAMQDAIIRVGDRYQLPGGWLNDDFTKTASFSPRLEAFSTYYKTFSNVLTIRTMTGEYLVVMKLRSGRQYKSDFSDVLGVLAEHEKRGTPISMERIRQAVTDLYGEWNALPETSRNFIINVMQTGHFQELYAQTMQGERETRNLLLRFEETYPGVTQEDNVDDIAGTLQKKASKAAILAQLRERQAGRED